MKKIDVISNYHKRTVEKKTSKNKKGNIKNIKNDSKKQKKDLYSSKKNKVTKNKTKISKNLKNAVKKFKSTSVGKLVNKYKIELPKRKLEESYSKELLQDSYKKLLEKNKEKINVNAANIEKIAITETVTVTSKVKDIFRELMKKPKFVFNKLCKSKKYTKLETVTAFTGLLELTRRNKVKAEQEKIFGDITVEKARD